jgi:hypothetical protein
VHAQTEKTFEASHDAFQVDGVGELGEVVDVLDEVVKALNEVVDELDEVVVVFVEVLVEVLVELHAFKLLGATPRPAEGPGGGQLCGQPLRRPTCMPGYSNA